MQDPRIRWVIVALAALLAVVSGIKVLSGRTTVPPVVITGAQTGPPPDYGPAPNFTAPSTHHKRSLGDAGGDSDATPPNDISTSSGSIEVHVAGAVKRSGLYTLTNGSRVADAIHAAGGPAAKADVDAVNLAEHLSDGEKVYIPHTGEVGVDDSAGAANAIGRGASDSDTVSSSHSGHSSNKLTVPGQGHVNINTASADELQKLPGVGPAMAARIIAYRQQNGPFKSPDDLMDVSGIGSKKMARMAPFVVVQ